MAIAGQKWGHAMSLSVVMDQTTVDRVLARLVKLGLCCET